MHLSEQDAMKVTTRYIGVEGGYLGDFSYRSHTDFYPEYCGIYDIFPDEIEGLTTRKRFIKILSEQSPDRQAKILRGVLEKYPADNEQRKQFMPTMNRWIDQLEGTPVVVGAKPVESMSIVVRQALLDAENLIKTSGPESAVDRVHTALHGHAQKLCDDAGILLPERPTLQMAVKQLRTQHLKLQPKGTRSEEVSRVLYSMAATVDALTTIRNNATPAHPNDYLLGREEAILAINAGRTIFAYLDSKVQS